MFRPQPSSAIRRDLGSSEKGKRIENIDQDGIDKLILEEGDRLI